MTRGCRALAMLLSLAAVLGHVWATDRFLMPGTSYSLEMPGTPTCMDLTKEAALVALEWRVCAYFDERVGQGYSIEYMRPRLVPDPENSKLALRGVAYGAAANSGSEVVEENLLDVDGYPALDAVIVTKQNGFTAYSRYVLIEDRLVTATLDAGGSPMTTETAIQFLGSLQVLAQQIPEER